MYHHQIDGAAFSLRKRCDWETAEFPELELVKQFIRKSTAVQTVDHHHGGSMLHIFRHFCRRCLSLHGGFTIAAEKARREKLKVQIPTLKMCESCRKAFPAEKLAQEQPCDSPGRMVHYAFESTTSKGCFGSRAYPARSKWPTETSGMWDNAVRALEDG